MSVQILALFIARILMKLIIHKQQKHSYRHIHLQVVIHNSHFQVKDATRFGLDELPSSPDM